VAAVLLALLGALVWGAGDFFGGLSARRTHVLTVLSLSLLVGLGGVAVWIAVAREPWPGLAALAPALGAGAAGAIGLGALYRGLALGAMAIVAPISAAAPVVPLAVDVLRGQSPQTLQWIGIALVLGGVAVLSREPVGGRQRRAAGVGLAIVAAAGFGTFYVLIAESAEESVAWAAGTSRLAAVALAFAAVLAMRAPLLPPRAILPAVVAAGLFDIGATLAVAGATTLGATGIVAVLSSLYPIVTIVLARVLLAETVDTSRRLGGGAALAGAALVAAG
jgi:drug/metabolite transporter (DMT)-like permease